MAEPTYEELEQRIKRLERLMLALLWGRPEQHQKIGYDLAQQVRKDSPYIRAADKETP